MQEDRGSLPGTWRFGAVELDETDGSVAVAGHRIEMSRSGTAVLFALVRARGAIVDKRQLLELGWPGRVVHENSLAKAVGSLRRALGDDGDAIEVVHGYGYRLAASVDAVGAEAVDHVG